MGLLKLGVGVLLQLSPSTWPFIASGRRFTVKGDLEVLLSRVLEATRASTGVLPVRRTADELRDPPTLGREAVEDARSLSL